ncbi:hypothetical protein [Sphingobium chlorophenolicum]|uniref:Uncharacterized protein n=1 Tax=Sphingobium chlorophenolicum TaxID=46429 RepID=A0A081RCY8_SPHCR|nr:hypothetical protein [Sphingobium chlorophenolicum]KEQ53061.1 hypothetical protein BV95_02717 [Sphingobium chlorophenolicum]
MTRAKSGGRQKGTPNKTTAMMKAAIEDVFQKLQDGDGGDNAHFLGWAKENPTEFYKLSSKLLPLQLTGADGGAIELSIADRINRARERMNGKDQDHGE